ncbi:MAG: zinc ribbon domain-containing protein [Candidatus Bathyarchaeia archaeon]
MKCPACGKEQYDTDFCKDCGKQLWYQCGKCGRIMAVYDKFCAICGTTNPKLLQLPKTLKTTSVEVP